MGDKVLIVEDEPTLLETLEYNLTRQGYEVYTATDGLKALEVARQEQPDAIGWTSCFLAWTALRCAASYARR
jgi:CheY-like chemotaxis protein